MPDPKKTQAADLPPTHPASPDAAPPPEDRPRSFDPAALAEAIAATAQDLLGEDKPNGVQPVLAMLSEVIPSAPHAAAAGHIAWAENTGQLTQEGKEIFSRLTAEEAAALVFEVVAQRRFDQPAVTAFLRRKWPQPRVSQILL